MHYVVCRHALEEVPMTGVMPFDEKIHGFIRQVVTGFTLGFWGKNINSMSLRAAALVLPWHRPPGQVWRRSNLHVVEGDCSPHWRTAQVSGKDKSALAMTITRRQ